MVYGHRQWSWSVGLFSFGRYCNALSKIIYSHDVFFGFFHADEHEVLAVVVVASEASVASVAGVASVDSVASVVVDFQTRSKAYLCTPNRYATLYDFLSVGESFCCGIRSPGCVTPIARSAVLRTMHYSCVVGVAGGVTRFASAVLLVKTGPVSRFGLTRHLGHRSFSLDIMATVTDKLSHQKKRCGHSGECHQKEVAKYIT